VADEYGAAAAVDPQRIVALEWLPVELMLALGVTPYGVADIPNYNLWVNEPALPDSVIDVGLRTEPNLELLTQMKPSFLFWSAGYGPSENGAHCARAGIHLQRR
jgi:iron complex transport system substrate-binding protein